MPSPVRFAYTRGFHAFSWAELSWPRLCRRTAAITCSTHSSWSTPTPLQWASFQFFFFPCFTQLPTQRKFLIPWAQTAWCLSGVSWTNWQLISRISWSLLPVMRSSWCQQLFLCCSAARGAYCCLSFITDSSLCATHPEEIHIAAPCSPSCEFFWSISSWSLPALPSSGGCASAVSPLSAASPPRGFDYTKFVFLMFCFSVRCTMWLNFDGERLCHQWKEPFFLNVNFTVCAPIFVYLSAAEDQPVMHWRLMLIFAFPSF